MKNTYKTTSETSIVREPSVAYGYTANYYMLAQKFISKDYIKHILVISRLSINELINLIPISIDTYKRKSEFNPAVTEKVLEIEEVYRSGLKAFGERFHHWMNTQNEALGGVVPKSLLSNSFGVRRLLETIGRIEHGVLA